MDDTAKDDELALRQGARLFPIGQALRASYDAENHESLGSDVAGLMIDLSHVEPPCPETRAIVESPEKRSLFAGLRAVLRQVWRLLRFRG